jgi:hypothetical protein
VNLVGSGWRAPERFVAKGRDGLTDIYGIMSLAQKFRSRKKYRVLE